MRIKLLFTNENAVSPVIGVILMVAITVILAAVIGTFVLGLGGDKSTTPQTRFDFKYNDIPQQVEINVTGGETIDGENTGIPEGCSNTAIKVLGLNGSAAGVSGSGPTGGYICWNSIPITATSGITVDVTPGTTVELKWVAPNGDTSQILDTFQVPA